MRVHDMQSLILSVAFAALLPVGCGPTSEEDPQVSNLSAVTELYAQCQARNRGQLPPDEATLRTFVQGEEAYLKARGFGSPDTIFVSERDGQPYVLLFGKDIISGAADFGDKIIAYEKEGKDGQRIVGYLSGSVTVITEDEFDNLVTAAK